MTEACVITSLPAGEYAAPGSSGKRIPDFDVRIVDDLDRELPTNITGEIVVRPLRPTIMFEGYWQRPADTLKVMRNMWFHTGDLGKFDDDDFFYFVDRKKDYLRRRGENISSFEMETAFASHPDVAEVAVHAVPSDKGEDDVKVTAILKPGATLTAKALFQWSTNAVPYYALPRYIEFREVLPKNPQGRMPHMRARGGGKVANFNSIDVDVGAWLHADYNTAKVGILGLTRSAAAEWGRFNITVNAIAPTAMGATFHKLCAENSGFAERSAGLRPLGRSGDPEEDIAPAVMFLASDMSRFMTGEAIHVDGGLHMPG